MKPESANDDTADALALIAAVATLSIFVAMARLVETALDTSIVVGSFGATTILMFALQGVDVVRPYNVVLGHVVSVTAGVLCRNFVAPSSIDAALVASVALTLAAMLTLRCTHPPGGAVAMICVLAPDEVAGDGVALAFGIALGSVGYLMIAKLVLATLALVGQRSRTSTSRAAKRF
ncbi:MAG: HPP family protein [Alphaproteobacteria bacterium]|nr:HPP family protein [Alphaproteobacteria bacterium]